MKQRTLDKIAKEEDLDNYEDLVETKLTAAWLDVEWAGRLLPASDNEAVRARLITLLAFAAQAASKEGLSREDAVRLVGEAYDEAAAIHDDAAGDDVEDEQ